jgi:ADP-glucose pyrophosphorylase
MTCLLLLYGGVKCSLLFCFGGAAAASRDPFIHPFQSHIVSHTVFPFIYTSRYQLPFTGKDCRIGDNVKITNSVILDGVILESGVSIQNSVVGVDCRLMEKCSLKDCQVGPGKTVQPGEVHKDETLGSNEEHH